MNVSRLTGPRAGRLAMKPEALGHAFVKLSDQAVTIRQIPFPMFAFAGQAAGAR